MALFITEQLFKDRTGISNNVDGKQIRPMLKVAQDIFLQPALGSTLYARLQSGVTNNNLNANEVALLNNYVQDCVIWATMSYLVIPLGYQVFSKGVLQKTAEGSSVPTKNDLDYIGSYYSDMAEHYKQRLVMYLKQNYTLFQEYADPGCGWDVIRPEALGYECPIYIGDTKKEWNYQDSSVKTYSHPKTYTYTSPGGETSFTAAVTWATLLIVSRAGVVRSVVTTATADTNELRVVGSVVTLPTGDATYPGEKFIFLYV